MSVTVLLVHSSDRCKINANTVAVPARLNGALYFLAGPLFSVSGEGVPLRGTRSGCKLWRAVR